MAVATALGEGVAQRLAALQFAEPALRAGLSEAWRLELRRRLVAQSRDRDDEIARSALRQLARDVDKDDKDSTAELIGLLEDALTHPNARVRFLAYRLLRRNAPRGRYLEAIHVLVNDRNPGLQRTAIRSLSWGGYLPAVPDIAGAAPQQTPQCRQNRQASAAGLRPQSPAAIASGAEQSEARTDAKPSPQSSKPSATTPQVLRIAPDRKRNTQSVADRP